MRPRDIKRLIDTALSAQKSAYSPYSRYSVGASVLTAGGRIFAGCNVENASYGLTVCAERIAVFNAITRNQRSLKAVCIVGTAAKPCGACRQVLFEFSTKETILLLVNVDRNTRKQTLTRTTVHKMLPSAFDPLASGLLAANPQNLLRAKSYASGPAPRRRKRKKVKTGRKSLSRTKKRARKSSRTKKAHRRENRRKARR